MTPPPRRWVRAVQYAGVLWIAITLNFALPRLAPGDPLEYVIGPELNTLTPSQQTSVRRELGLDGTVLEQYGAYLAGVLTGDLGVSIRFAQPVTDVLLDRLPWTLLLVLPSTLLAAVSATALGVIAAWKRGHRRDVALVTGTLFLDALPSFWVAMMLITIFAVHLGWFPSFGAAPIAPAGGLIVTGVAVAHRLILPVTALTVVSLGHLLLLSRGAMLTAFGEEYVFMARAKGLRERTVVVRHALRNALLPVYTHVALSLGGVFSGAVLVETVFAYPGMGRLVFEAVSARDYPMLQGAFLLFTAAVIAANWIADITYPLLDPRVRAAGRRA